MDGPTQHRPLPAAVERIATQIVDAALTVHRFLGPGYHERVDRQCLAEELRIRKLRVSEELRAPIVYADRVIENAVRLDLLVEDEVVVELKTVTELLPVHRFQLLGYLRVTGKRLGLLINFHSPLIRDGIRRVIA